MTHTLISTSVAKTVELGIHLGEQLQAHDLICLHGNLGAGKTAFARGVGAGWGSTVRVTSPTYVLINEYPRHDGVILYHLDCYRLESAADTITTGIEDILDMPAPILIEWPERVAEFLPAERLNIHLTYTNDTTRTITLNPIGARAETLALNLAKANAIAFKTSHDQPLQGFANTNPEQTDTQS